MNARYMFVSAIGILTLLLLGTATLIGVERSRASGVSRADRRPVSPLQVPRYSLDSGIRASVPLTTATAIRTITSTPVPLTSTPTPCSINFSDVDPSDYFYEDVLWLYCHGVISGYSDGTFRPYNSVTRGQSIKIIVLAFDIPVYVPPDPVFCGVPSTDPFFIYITSYFYYTGTQCEGDFNPYAHMTRGQLTKVIVRIACWPIDTTGGPHFSDVPPTDVFYDYIETVYNRGIISGYGDGTFRSNNNVTRGQASKIIHRAVLQGSNCPPYFTPTPPVPTFVP